MMDRLMKLSTTHGILPHKCRCNPVSKYTGHASTRVCLLAYLPACLPAGLCTCRPAYLPPDNLLACLPGGLLICSPAYQPACLLCLHAGQPSCLPAYLPACLLFGLSTCNLPACRPAHLPKAHMFESQSRTGCFVCVIIGYA